MAHGVQIGKVARATGLSVDTIRFYEKEGLLREPERSEGGFRLYSARDIQNLHFIHKAQELGFPSRTSANCCSSRTSARKPARTCAISSKADLARCVAKSRI